MKKIIILCFALFATAAIAHTIDWYVDGQIYQTTSCESGDNITPPTPPTKYGYTFQYWNDPGIIEGIGIQSGTPTPTNPIYPTFYQNGDLILRSITSGNDRVFDTYNSSTGKITRRIGVKVLKGTENWSDDNGENYIYVNISERVSGNSTHLLLTHFRDSETIKFMETNIGWRKSILTSLGLPDTVADFKQWLADEYANGTPVTIYYPLATPVEENYVPNQQ